MKERRKGTSRGGRAGQATTAKTPDAQVPNADTPALSAAGSTAVKKAVAEYKSELVAKAQREARRHYADTVSADHVEHARRQLADVLGKHAYRHMGAVGGLALGACLSNLVAMTGTQVSMIRFLFMIGLAAAGAAMVAVHIAKD